MIMKMLFAASLGTLLMTASLVLANDDVLIEKTSESKTQMNQTFTRPEIGQLILEGQPVRSKKFDVVELELLHLYEAEQQRIVLWDEFYDKIGGPALAREYRLRKYAKWGLYGSSILLIGASFLSFLQPELVGSVAGENLDLISGTLLVSGAILFVGGNLIDKHPIGFNEMKRLVLDHNKRQKARLQREPDHKENGNGQSDQFSFLLSPFMTRRGGGLAFLVSY